tara:strand:+ start:75 stop:644 length:570 start_codon:yes stop_codon:yes gene_type:complete
MIVDKTILSKAMSAIVSPHGITDYIHAKKYGYLQELYKINLVTVTSGTIIGYFHYDAVLNIIFLFSSIIHFRNDMPELNILRIDKKMIQIILSTLFVLSLHVIPVEYFAAYMVFIHTPNHYKMGWFYIKENVKETLVLVLGLGIILSNIDDIDFLSFPVIHFIQSVVISHIIYEESFVFENFDKKFLNF